jgi:hypothetical protein
MLGVCEHVSDGLAGTPVFDLWLHFFGRAKCGGGVSCQGVVMIDYQVLVPRPG